MNDAEMRARARAILQAEMERLAIDGRESQLSEQDRRVAKIIARGLEERLRGMRSRP